MKLGVQISPSTAMRAAMRPGEPPGKGGAQLIVPQEVEHKLESMCLALRELNLPIFRFMIMNYVNTLIAGTSLAEQLVGKEVRRHWYYNWLGRCQRLTTGNIRPLEITRAQWATPENVKKHYDMLAVLMVELNIAVPNPAYDPTVENSEVVKIAKPERIFSMDETRLTNDTTEKSKAKANRSLVGRYGDQRECLVNKGGGDGTGIGGSSADGRDLPAFFIFSKNIIHAGEQDNDVKEDVRPLCRRMDPSDPGKPLPCRFWANAKGGVTGDLGIRYIRGCLEPCLPDLSPDNPALLIMDGHGSHFTLELLDYCKQVGLHVLLRPPHTTHILQGEDVQHFAVFKPEYHQAKLRAIASKVAGGVYRLSVNDLLRCAKEPWEHAFDLSNLLKAWDKIGVSPFTRRVYWDLMRAQSKREEIAKQVQVDPELLSVHGMVQIMFPQATNPASSHAPSDAASAPAAAGGMLAARGRKKRGRETLNSSDLWDLPGGATGEECYQMVKAKTEVRLAKQVSAKRKKEKRINRRQKESADQNELGARVVGALTHEAQTKTLVVAQLRAALAYRSVAAAPTLKKAELRALLDANLSLSKETPAPPLQLPAPIPAAVEVEAPSAAPTASDEPEEEADNEDEDCSSQSSDSDDGM